MFEEWHDFYLLVGGASGALIGLMFVVASLSGNLEERQNELGQRLYFSPIVFHFSVILGIGGLAMAPAVPRAACALLVGAAALGGLGYAAFVIREFVLKRTPSPPHWSDVWFYGAITGAAYAAMAASALLIAVDPAPGALLLAASQVGLLAVSIRNAWDLITFIAPLQKDGKTS